MKNSEGKSSFFSSRVLLPLYKKIKSESVRSLLRRAALRLEGGTVYSLTVREIYKRYHGVQVGLYTIGPCESTPENFAYGTVIGRYSSVYYTARTLARDEPGGGEPACAPFFEADEPPNDKARLIIGNDVYVGHNVTIIQSAGEIGTGAVIGAGSVVRKPVPPYAIATGNPARVVRYRFSKEKIQELLDSQWWLKTQDELRGEIAVFQKPVEETSTP